MTSKLVVDFLWKRDTFRKQSWKSSSGKLWKSSRILRLKPKFSSFSSFSSFIFFFLRFLFLFFLFFSGAQNQFFLASIASRFVRTFSLKKSFSAVSGRYTLVRPLFIFSPFFLVFLCFFLFLFLFFFSRGAQNLIFGGHDFL